jgi:hypothetical protein
LAVNHTHLRYGAIHVVDPEYKGVWRDGDYLIVRNRVASFPVKCLACGQDINVKKTSCKIRKRPGIMQFLLWWTGVFSPAVLIKPYLCAKHRKRELQSRWIGYVILLIAIAMTACPFVWIAKGWHLNSIVILLPFGTMLLSAWVYYRIFRLRLFYAAHISRRDAWIDSVDSSILALVPTLPEPTK